MRKLYKFHWDCGRQGELDGLFAAEDSQIEEVIGKTVNFGEVLGKHSEIYGELQEEDFKVLTDDQEFIDKTIEFGMIPIGYSPLDYLEEE